MWVGWNFLRAGAGGGGRRSSRSSSCRTVPRRLCALVILQRQAPAVQVVHHPEGAPDSVHRQSADLPLCRDEKRRDPTGAALGQGCGLAVLVQTGNRGVSARAVLGQGCLAPCGARQGLWSTQCSPWRLHRCSSWTRFCSRPSVRWLLDEFPAPPSEKVDSEVPAQSAHGNPGIISSSSPVHGGFWTNFSFFHGRESGFRVPGAVRSGNLDTNLRAVRVTGGCCFCFRNAAFFGVRPSGR